jgi:hypothetical protein
MICIWTLTADIPPGAMGLTRSTSLFWAEHDGKQQTRRCDEQGDSGCDEAVREGGWGLVGFLRKTLDGRQEKSEDDADREPDGADGRSEPAEVRMIALRTGWLVGERVHFSDYRE